MAAQRLGIPDRQCRRLLSRYNQSGPLSMPNLIFLIPRISTRTVVQKKLQEKR
ncbi:hypothetical protein [Klebsiella pneumoniae]|uniref:hypothetical protein n=1 Tax=Klebsiella pneumoniae TaxID=573 RepID=UPI001F2A4EEF|nr:hypothetical protein [Klebsiella pneumoniae]MCE7393246.1 hypothetical protein [Klebsiella pneumoniae]